MEAGRLAVRTQKGAESLRVHPRSAAPSAPLRSSPPAVPRHFCPPGPTYDATNRRGPLGWSRSTRRGRISANRRATAAHRPRERSRPGARRNGGAGPTGKAAARRTEAAERRDRDRPANAAQERHRTRPRRSGDTGSGGKGPRRTCRLKTWTGSGILPSRPPLPADRPAPTVSPAFASGSRGAARPHPTGEALKGAAARRSSPLAPGGGADGPGPRGAPAARGDRPRSPDPSVWPGLAPERLLAPAARPGAPGRCPPWAPPRPGAVRWRPRGKPAAGLPGAMRRAGGGGAAT